MFDFDAGSDGASGPFINWHANGRKDGTAGAKSFSMKGDGDREDVTPNFEKGVVFDIDSLKTGWALFSPTGTEWKWNDTVSRMSPKPGDDWKKGLSIRIATSKDESGLWQQAGAGAFQAFAELAKELKDGERGKLPLVKMTGTFDLQFGNGGSTTCAKLEVAKWVDRPDSLAEGAGAEAVADEPADDDEF